MVRPGGDFRATGNPPWVRPCGLMMLLLTRLIIPKGGRREKLEDFPQEGVGVECMLWVGVVGVGWV